MTAYQKAQAFNNLRWGCMPVTLLIGGEIAQARARGACSVAVADPAQLASLVPDSADLQAALRPQITRVVTDFLGERSAQGLDTAQFTTVTPAAVQSLHERLAPRLADMGLELKAVTIEAIERV